jgi:hypothetical protein
LCGGAVGERLEAGAHLLDQGAGLVGHAEVGGVRPGHDLDLGEVRRADQQLEQVEVEAAERAFQLAERLGSVRDRRNALVGWAVLFEG